MGKIRNERILIISLHLAGGCYYYSNHIFSHFKGSHDVVIPDITCESGNMDGTKTVKYFGYNPIIRYVSLLWLLIRLLILGFAGYYKGLVLSGFTSWDIYICRVWKFTGRPLFYVVHDGKMHTGEAVTKNQKRLIECMKLATNLIFLSEYVRMCVYTNFGISKPYSIVPHGLISYGDIPKQKKTLLPTFLFLGRGSWYKGLDILMDAIEKVDDNVYSKLIIAGELSSDIKSIIKLKAIHKSSKYEIIDKWLDLEEIKTLIGLSDIMLFPYREASQSGAIMLALQYEIPHIISNVGALAEQTDPSCAVIIDDMSAEKLADAISKLCMNQRTLQNMHRECAKIKEKYSWETIAEDFERYIRKEL